MKIRKTQLTIHAIVNFFQPFIRSPSIFFRC